LPRVSASRVKDSSRRWIS